MKNVFSFFPENQLSELSSFVFKNSRLTISGGGNQSSKAFIFSSLKIKEEKNILWVVNDENEINVLKKDLSFWTDRDIYTYKKRNNDDRLSFNNNRRFEDVKSFEVLEFVLRQKKYKNSVFVIDYFSLFQEFPDFKILDKIKIFLEKNSKYNQVSFIQKLVQIGYDVCEEEILTKGSYIRRGDVIDVFPLNNELPIKVFFDFDRIEKIVSMKGEEFEDFEIYPTFFNETVDDFFEVAGRGMVYFDDEVDVLDDFYNKWNNFITKIPEGSNLVSFSSFNDDVFNHKHLHFMSVLKYRNGYDLANDFRDKISAKWKIFYFTKHQEDVEALLKDQKIPFAKDFSGDNFNRSSVFIFPVDKNDSFAHSFQNPEIKIMVLSDNDVSLVKEVNIKNISQNIFNDFLTSLKTGDFVVHVDHGIAKFLGLEKKTVDNITKEYLKLGYAENDKLFVPIDQADKVNKYIGSEDSMPKLTRLGSADWNTITSKVKKETQEIAKELLKLYAERKAAKGFAFKKDDEMQIRFEEKFPYEETPGQIKAIIDVKNDMESAGVMDRLVCGDVGFGKTEVAIRAAFKSFRSGKQVALISPITILADQHYKSFKSRMEDFNVRVEMLSRFRRLSDQEKIIKKLQNGEIDIIVGTHRLLQPDIRFKDLGLVIIDEEQRFGVKQKEKLKEMRKEVDILTLTATPIPRTLNICLNKLRDITTITTPPYGRLPVITEVRKYSSSLVCEAIRKELARGGQIYFLHNRVQTIDGFTEQLKIMVPEARFIVAHGKLGSGDLEARIMDFKEGKYDVLVSSTIIENGIDLENANTLIVNNAEKFGLAQLYQLRGRVGRGKTQAYAYFLYHGQRLKIDAKKRLRAIVEASELGSGFQIAMKDLEIRGAGDILGANQHGVINVVGVSHFIRMLNKAVEDLRAGRVMEGEEEIEDVSIELPLQAFIPDDYIGNSKDKISAYQKLSAADNFAYLRDLEDDFLEEYGKFPEEVKNLFKIIELKILAKKANILNVRAEVVPMSKEREIVLHMSNKVRPANIVNLLEKNSKWKIVGNKLRINQQDLQVPWILSLLENIESLGSEAKHGVQ